MYFYLYITELCIIFASKYSNEKRRKNSKKWKM